MELNPTIINAAGNGQIEAGLLVGSAAAQVGAAKQRVRVVSNLAQQAATSPLMSNGTTQLTGTDSVGFTVFAPCRNLRFVYLNGIYSSSGITQGAGGVDAGGAPLPGNAVRFSAKLRTSASRIALSFPGATGNPVSTASGTGSIAGTALTWTPGAGILTPGMPLSGAGVAAGTYVVSGSGTSFVVSPSQTVASTAMTGKGSSETIIGDRQFVVSQPVPGLFVPGTTYTVDTYHAVAAGEKWPYTLRAGDYASSSGNRTTDPVNGSTTADGSDTSNSSNATTGFVKSGYTGQFAPALIVGDVGAKSVVGVFGHSIAQGFGDTLGRGYMVRALENASLGYAPLGISGTTPNNITNYAQLVQFAADYVDHAWSDAWTNMLNSGTPTLASMQAQFINMMLVMARPNVKQWFSTVLPYPASNDNYTTYSGQTPGTGTGSFTAANEITRIQFNNWLRDQTASGAVAALIAAGLTAAQIGGVVDVCSGGIERNADGSVIVLNANGQQDTATGGRWLVNGTANYMTTDGRHPTTAGAIAISTVPDVVSAVAKMSVIP